MINFSSSDISIALIFFFLAFLQLENQNEYNGSYFVLGKESQSCSYLKRWFALILSQFSFFLWPPSNSGKVMNNSLLLSKMCNIDQ